MEEANWEFPFKIFHRIPSHHNDPIANFLPIEDDRVNFLDVTNNGLVPGENPNQKAMEFWSHIEKELHEIYTKSVKIKRVEL